MSTTVTRTLVGSPVDRIDGPEKVTGTAQYAADAPVANALHAVLVQSTISRGRIRTVDEDDARAIPGVVEILTYRNAPRVEPTGFNFAIPTTYVEAGLQPLQGPEVVYWGQHVAVAIATTLEAARRAAGALRIAYDEEPALLTLDAARDRRERVEQWFGSPVNVERGDLDAALATADVAVDAVYTTPDETHNPLEPCATVAQWDGDRLTVYDPSQYVIGTRNTLAHFFGLPPEHVHVIAPFVGGGFGAKGWTWPHTVIAAMAAKATGRPVKLVLDRSQSFSSSGHRSQTEQRMRLAGMRDGRITGIGHDVLTVTGRVGDWQEACGRISPWLYDVPNVRVTHHTVRIDIATPTAMRGPGEAPGTFALESAVDEFAAALEIDPLELRVRNHAERDPASGKPYSSKHLLACYREGARRFGWERRAPRPRALREGDEWVGYGMASATFPAFSSTTEARARVEAPGRVSVASATHDLGTGMYTIIAQVAAQTLGLPLDHIDVRIGDSGLPRAPVAGGSQSTASVAPAVADACRKLLAATGGALEASVVGTEAIGIARDDYDEEHYEFHSFGAQFCEVRVDSDLARVRVTRWVGVFDAGRIVNPKTARSQLAGGIIMGLGMALNEETVRDPRSGALVGNNLAEYRIPVNADIPPIEIGFIEEPDLHLNPLGVRGLGEIGITGVAAAVANAIYHAVGTRVRDLPILPEKLL